MSVPDEAISQVTSPVAEQSACSIGRTCEVYFDDKWFNATVHSVTTSDQKHEEKVIVKIMGRESYREYLTVDIKLLPVIPVDQFSIGSKVQAIWKDDGLWYNAELKAVTAEGEFEIAYDGFDTESVILPRDQVRVPVVVNKQKKPLVISANEPTYVTPAGYVIPEKLKIDPLKDAEDVIAKKKRKIHALKSQQKGDKYVEEISSNVNKWQSFQQKFGGKLHKPN